MESITSIEQIKSNSTILIVDDSEENVIALGKILEKHNYKTDSAGSGEIALKKVLKTRYSLILLDVQMPGMNGYEVAEALRGTNNTMYIPLIFLTALNKSQAFDTGSETGPLDYLVKPFDLDLLIVKINNFLRFDYLAKELEMAKKEIFVLKQKALAASYNQMVQ